MAKVVGDIAVEVSADIGPLQRGLRSARGDVGRFGRSTEQMAQRATRATVAMTAAFAAATAAGLALANRVGELGERITNLSRVAGTTPEKFQEWAAASRSVGIEQEKLADILKDVQDRVGDFLATGGGPMADFFENIAPKVGVTAEQFARLSGPEALRLYVRSLEQANVTQNEMTFYLEAMSSDLTMMLPLLRDNGREMDRLGREAREAGAILSNDTVRGADELAKKMREMSDQMYGELIPALISVEDELALLAQFVTDYGIPALTSLIELAGGAAEKFQALAGWIKSLGGNPRFFDDQGNEYDQYNNLIASPNMSVGEPLDLGEIALPPAQGGDGGASVRRGGGGGGGRSGPTEEDLERLRDQFATEQEIIQENYEKQLEQLQEFRDRKLTTEEEFNELERRIQKEHQEKMLDLERARRDATLSAVSGALGDVASLMQTENKKLFAIGKAAAIAEATVSGYQAAVDAWQKGMKVGGPPVAAAFTAASIAKTGALISSIASTSYGGGSGGASSAGGGVGVAATPSAPQNNQYVNVNLTGEGPIGRGSIRGLIEQINEAIDDGAVIRGITVSG